MKGLLPNFLIVGAARSGTTSIYNYLKVHPDIYMTELKEPTFFSYANQTKPVFTKGREVDFVTDIKDYIKLYENSNGEKILGEASTPYLYLFEKTINNIKIIIPEYRKIKILILLRNPIDRAYSQYMVRVRDLKESLSFEDAIKAEERRMNKNAHFDYFYIDRGLYYAQVKAYLDNFDNVKICYFEDLSKNPKKVINNILKFLNVSAIENINLKEKYNFSGNPKIQILRKIIIDKFFFKTTIKKIIPKSMKIYLLNIINKYNLEQIPMKQTTEKILIDIFKTDIVKLEKLLSVDLSHWYDK